MINSNSYPLLRWSIFIVAVLILFVALLQPANANVVIRNLDGAGEGFNDPTSVASVGGNSATTLGQQRLNVFNRAAAIINQMISSPINIVVGAKFDPLRCTSSGAVLGSAGPKSYEFEQTSSGYNMYPQALFNSLTGQDGNGTDIEINATFNNLVDGSDCLGNTRWYYGYDNQLDGDMSLLSVVLHELVHGLGFLSLLQADGRSSAFYENGSNREDIFDPYTKNLYSSLYNQPLTNLSQDQRAAALIADNNLLWNGENTNRRTEQFSRGINQNKIQMYAPPTYRSGSSVSHFDNRVSPAELMEPSYSSFMDDVGTARYVLQDIGWPLNEVEVNEAPRIVNLSNVEMDEDTRFEIQLKVIDANDDDVIVRLTEQGSQLNARLNNGVLTIAPDRNYYGSSSITINATDGNKDRDHQIPIVVKPINDAPILTQVSNISVNEDSSRSITLRATDVDGDSLTYFISDSTKELNAFINGNRLIVDPVSNFFGSGQILVRVSDGITTDSQTINVRVNPVNDRPVLSLPSNLTASSSQVSTFNLAARDVDGDALSFRVIYFNSQILNASFNGNTLTISPRRITTSSTGIYVSVSDGKSQQNQYLRINWSNSSNNTAPSLAVADQAVTVNKLTTIPFTLQDRENNLVTLLVDSLQTDRQLNARWDGRHLTVQPAQLGQFKLAIKASDGKSNVLASATITVGQPLSINVNGETFAANDTINTQQEQLSLSFGNAAINQISVNFNGQALANAAQKVGDQWLFDLSGRAVFAGIYTLVVTDPNGFQSQFYIERSPTISLVTSPLLAIDEPQPVIIRGIANYTQLALSTNRNGIVWCNKNGDLINWMEIGKLTTPGELVMYLKYQNSAAQARQAFGNTEAAARQARLSIESADLPSSALDIEVLATNTITVTVRGPQNELLEGITLSIDEPKMLAWGLESQKQTNHLGEVQMTVPMRPTPARLLPAGMVPIAFVIEPDQSDIKLNVVESNAAYWLIGSVTANLNFYEELPVVEVLLNSGVKLKPNVALQTRNQASFLWSSNFDQGRPVSVAITHSGASTRVIELNSSKEIESVEASLVNAARLVDIDTTDRGGKSGGALSSLSLLLVFAYLLRMLRIKHCRMRAKRRYS